MLQLSLDTRTLTWTRFECTLETKASLLHVQSKTGLFSTYNKYYMHARSVLKTAHLKWHLVCLQNSLCKRLKQNKLLTFVLTGNLVKYTFLPTNTAFNTWSYPLLWTLCMDCLSLCALQTNTFYYYNDMKCNIWTC